ncbi:MAG: tight adherence protein C [Bermanella sp.]|jgi:tight adherence protein C
MESWHLIILACVAMLGAVPVLLRASRVVDLSKTAPTAPHEKQKPAARTARRKRTLQGMQLEPWKQLRRQYRSIDEIAKNLRYCGINSAADQTRYLIIAIGSAGLVTLVSWLVMLTVMDSTIKASLYSVMTLIAILILLNRGLKTRAALRQKALEEEALMLIQSTRMLWRVGLSMPKTLAILCDELRHLTPNTASELRVAVKRIDAGQAQDDALQELSNHTIAEGFREYLIILRQESASGGGIDAALQELYEVLQSRRKTSLQEKVSKTSANMSIVMMLMMFPSLIIVIGGPGYIAVSKALTTLNGG